MSPEAINAHDKIVTSVNDKESVAAIPDDWCGTGTVLVADDDEFILKLSSRMLGILGFTPLVVDNGSKALVAFQEQKDNIVCTIIDVSMPGISGEAASEGICAIDPDAKIIICSGHDGGRVALKINRLRQFGYLEKPFDLQDMRKALHDALD